MSTFCAKTSVNKESANYEKSVFDAEISRVTENFAPVCMRTAFWQNIELYKQRFLQVFVCVNFHTFECGLNRLTNCVTFAQMLQKCVAIGASFA